MTQPSIHLATVEDLPWIRQLWKEMVEEGGPPYPTNILGSIDAFTRSIALALTMTPPQAWVFLAQLPDSPTPDAFLAYEIQARALGEPSRIAFVHYVYTRPGARGRGLLSTIFELAAEHMAAQGLDVVEGTALPDNQGWYELGFVAYELRGYAPVAGIGPAVAARRRRRANGHTDPFDVPPPVTEPEEETDDDV